MPAFFDTATGKRVTAEVATWDGERTRPGFHAVLEDGEHVRFSINMLDGAGSGRNSVFLTDVTKDADVAIAADVARQRMVHDQRFAFLGDKAPAFDDGTAKLIAAARVNAGNAAVRDAAREYAATDPGVETARTGMIADLHGAGRTTGADLADVRNLARGNQY